MTTDFSGGPRGTIAAPSTMAPAGPIYEGHDGAQGLRVALVAARFNQVVVGELVRGAQDAFRRAGGAAQDLHLAWVPGAYEVPLVAKRLAASGQFDAVVCLGAVIRGSTPHFDYVAGQAAAGTMQAALNTGVPCIFGILTTDTVEQAMDRAGLKAGNKGIDAMRAAVETAQLLKQLPVAAQKDGHATSR